VSLRGLSFHSFCSFKNKGFRDRQVSDSDSDAWKLVGETLNHQQHRQVVMDTSSYSTTLFGGSRDLSGDGRVYVAGEPNHNENTGRVFVFMRDDDDNDNWQLSATLVGEYSASSESGNHLGTSVSLSADASTLAVSCRREDTDDTTNDIQMLAKVYIYDLTVPDWPLKNITIEHGGHGYGVKLSAHGTKLLTNDYGPDMYERSADGSWKLTASFDSAYWDIHSFDISAHDDGYTRVVVGDAYSENGNGVVYVYSLVGDSWQNTTLHPSGRDEYFGSSVAISEDSRRISKFILTLCVDKIEMHA
jgi:hypothetical protein